MSEQRKLTRREQAEQYLKIPEVRRYLDFLSWAEGTEQNGYNTTFGNKRWEDLSHHPNKVWGRTGDGPTTATGRYQILGSTWKEQQKALGLKDFGPESQDLAAVSLIMRRGAINDIINGDVDTANKKLSKEWASLPYNTSPHQSQKKKDAAMRKWQQLQSSGGLNQIDGGNYDYVTPKQNTEVASSQSSNPQNWFSNLLPETAQAPQQIQSVQQQTQRQPIDPFKAFTDNFNQLNGTLDTFAPIEPINNQEKYAKQLASAFGEEPSTNGLLDYGVSDLVKSIYDQTA
ncbi:hypothetical protein BMT54_01615 [Pasteurellaceae bacterium 15-036681]|nr:hypothetical protein BMT54_01615 [Pasteurellaceae bacterium 15-036681]